MTKDERAVPAAPEPRPYLAATEDAIEQVREKLPDDEVLYDLAELFKVFGDTTRVKILYVLFESELCVGHQLRLLKACKLVRFRQEGKMVFYALDDDHVRSMLALGLEHIAE